MARPQQDKAELSAALAMVMMDEYFAAINQNLDANGKVTSESIAKAKASTLLGSLGADGDELDTLTRAYFERPTSTENSPSASDSATVDDITEEHRQSLEERAEEEDQLDNFEIACRFLQIASDYLSKKRFDLASKVFLSAGRYLVGQDSSFPAISDGHEYGVESPAYRGLREDIRFHVMRCCRGLSDSDLGVSEGKAFNRSITWMYEAELLVKNRRFGDPMVQPFHDWFQFTGALLPPRTTLEFVDCLITKAEMFKSVGNTGAYQHNIKMANRFLLTIPNNHDSYDDETEVFIALLKASRMQRMDKAIIFGGCNETCLRIIGDNRDRQIHSVIYADTFMWSPPGTVVDSQGRPIPTPGDWRQIQTIGFPTYRTHTHLAEDPDTGDIYLYGGEVVGYTLPSKNQTEAQRTLAAHREKTYTRNFGDVWKLHIDIPGGDFESIDLISEMETARVGPWQRCFECLKAGFWKKCGGSCGGKVFFCGVDCQKKGWKEHKETHGCRSLGKSTRNDARNA